MTRVLVTGGCGFIGSCFVRMAIDERDDVEITNLDALTYAGNPDNVAPVADSPRYRFVRGDIRTYKIHLGSGNILMEPSDQYLCIVPKGRSKKADEVFLPFEGDGRMSVILSKAFLLAEDTKIKDATILSQIRI